MPYLEPGPLLAGWPYCNRASLPAEAAAVYPQSRPSEVPQEETLSGVLKDTVNFTCELVGRNQRTGKSILINGANEFVTNTSIFVSIFKKNLCGQVKTI